MPKSQDLYAVLGVPRTATAAEVRRSFRALARLHHPDVNRGDAAAERRFQRITAAYRVLGNRRKRLEYDERLLTGRFAPADLGMPASFQVDRDRSTMVIWVTTAISTRPVTRSRSARPRGPGQP